MKYKVGDNTLIGEITEADPGDEVLTYLVKIEGSPFVVWRSESEIDKVIIKPKRNIDHIIELLEDGKEEAARKFYNELVPLSEGYAVADEIYYFLKPYTELSKHPQLTPEEIKALKLARDCGFDIVYKNNYDSNGVAVAVKSEPISYWFVGYAPSLSCLADSDWITNESMSISELLDAQEEID